MGQQKGNSSDESAKSIMRTGTKMFQAGRGLTGKVIKKILKSIFKKVILFLGKLVGGSTVGVVIGAIIAILLIGTMVQSALTLDWFGFGGERTADQQKKDEAYAKQIEADFYSAYVNKAMEWYKSNPDNGLSEAEMREIVGRTVPPDGLIHAIAQTLLYQGGPSYPLGGGGGVTGGKPLPIEQVVFQPVNEATAGPWMTFETSAYVALCEAVTIDGKYYPACSGITATGLDVRNTSVDHRVVAVDPKVIPIHSIVEIEGYGQWRAEDTGGYIKGQRLDILMNSKQQALQWGRRNIRARVVGHVNGAVVSTTPSNAASSDSSGSSAIQYSKTKGYKKGEYPDMKPVAEAFANRISISTKPVTELTYGKTDYSWKTGEPSSGGKKGSYAKTSEKKRNLFSSITTAMGSQTYPIVDQLRAKTKDGQKVVGSIGSVTPWKVDIERDENGHSYQKWVEVDVKKTDTVTKTKKEKVMIPNPDYYSLYYEYLLSGRWSEISKIPLMVEVERDVEYEEKVVRTEKEMQKQTVKTWKEEKWEHFEYTKGYDVNSDDGAASIAWDTMTLNSVLAEAGIKPNNHGFLYEIAGAIGDFDYGPFENGTALGEFGTAPGDYAFTGEVKGGFTFPTPYSQRLTSPMGQRWGKMHWGVDMGRALHLASPKNLHIVAAHDGTVEYSGAAGGFGTLVVICQPGRELCTRYGHMDVLYAKQGQTVKAGDLIGIMGDQGQSTAVHLHFETFKPAPGLSVAANMGKINSSGGKAYNPMTFLQPLMK
ncbi:peptidoglycan DD-metalloendopeptidase family protein [Niallia taxi]|uniref:peptidoglycan DD-metalloendopeptidase family protein n=1 Tax=Niallia taxi TaxID=2499688 RepID=UPI0015F38E5D|nr:peptidoglycan DD-metalloendopeptidase family protein [Niallia taxi]